jgi:hypothetical protein
MATSTTTTLNDITYSAAIDTVFMGYVMDFRVVEPFLREYDLAGRGSATIQVPSLASNLGTVGDGGTGVDTEFNGTEGTDLSTTTTQSTNSVTIASAEYAVYMLITDNVGEDSVPGGADAVMEEIMQNAAEILLQAYEDDVWALFAALNGGTAVGTSGQNITLANLSTAIVTVRNNGVRAPDGLVGCLAPIQAQDIEEAVTATSTSMAIYDATSDRFMNLQRATDNGLGNGFCFAYRGVPFFMSGLADAANTNADKVGAVFVPSTPGNNRYAALGKTISRPLRIEFQRDATQRGDEIVATMRWGSGELQDKAGVPLVTDL